MAQQPLVFALHAGMNPASTRLIDPGTPTAPPQLDARAWVKWGGGWGNEAARGELCSTGGLAGGPSRRHKLEKQEARVSCLPPPTGGGGQRTPQPCSPTPHDTTPHPGPKIPQLSQDHRTRAPSDPQPIRTQVVPSFVFWPLMRTDQPGGPTNGPSSLHHQQAVAGNELGPSFPQPTLHSGTCPDSF